MKAKLTPSQAISVEIDGVPITGNFYIESEWEGFLKLKSTIPVMTVIVRKPERVGNPYDYVTTLFGGGQAPEKTKSIEAEVISQDAYFPKAKT